MMIKILYIGNKLSNNKSNFSTIEKLGYALQLEKFDLKYSSSINNKFFRIIDMMFCTLKYSKKSNYVLIDTYSTQNFWYAIIISQLSRILNVKYIPILHGGNLPNRLEKNPFLCDLIFKNAYKITAPSNYLFEAFKNKYSKNLIYIPNTIEIENYQLHSKTYENPKLLWVRSFSKIYNPKMAIHVLSDLKKTFPNAQLCMVGPDKENLINECEKIAKKLNVKVTFTGKLSKNEWIDLAKNYNIFINTTHFDNTPISVIEAMAIGLPIVSTNVGGIPFLLKNNENAYLVQDNNIEEMVQAIISIFDNPQKTNELTKNARILVENFDWNNVKHQWIEILS